MNRSNEERQTARELYLQSAGEMPLNEIARRVGRPAGTVRGWKHRDGWDRLFDTGPVPAPCPAPKHGLYGVPKKVRHIMEDAKGLSEKTLLWEVILYQYAAIVRAQELMYVRDGDDTLFPARGEDGESAGAAYDPHAPWDRHESFMRAQSRAVTALSGSLRVYQQLAYGVHRLDAGARQARRQEQRVKKLSDGQPADIHILTHIPRPGRPEGTKL